MQISAIFVTILIFVKIFLKKIGQFLLLPGVSENTTPCLFQNCGKVGKDIPGASIKSIKG